MQPRQPIPVALANLAVLQAGVVTREQAVALGFSRHAIDRQIRSAHWQRLCSGIYFAAPVQPSWESWAWGGVLAGGDAARLGGRAAAYLLGLADSAPELITVLVPGAGGRPRVQGPWAFVREAAGTRSARCVGSPPRLTTEDTVLDLVDEATDERDVIDCVTSAVQSRLTTPDRLRRALERRSRLRHRRMLNQLLADVAEGARSPLELAFLRDVERPHGLPTAQRQVRRRGTEADVLYEEYGLLVELDGRRGHEGLRRFRDMARDNWATTDGLATLRYGQRDVFGSACLVAAQVGANLMRRGWAGPPERCRRCRRAA